MYRLRNMIKKVHSYSSYFLVNTLFISCIGSILVFDVKAEQASDSVAPEFSTSSNLISDSTTKHAYAKEFMAVTAHPLATRAAFDVLEGGGSAIDAMVAVQAVLGLVEPQSSGLGGGAFALYYDANTKQLLTYDGRETAPLQSGPSLFMSNETTPMQFFEAVVGGRSVGTPGTVKLLWDMHQQYGQSPWPSLLKPAIKLAKEGFTVSERMSESVKRDEGRLNIDPEAAHYFYPNGKAIEAGSLLKNQAYAKTLEYISKYGGDKFYSSEISKAIIEKVQRASNKGYLTQQDFDSYKVILRSPVCINYHEYNVCGMGPPSSGAISVNQTLGVLENLEISNMPKDDPQTWQVIAEASRLAFADRGHYIADPDFISVPTTSLLAKPYLTKRSKLIQPAKANADVSYGSPSDVIHQNTLSGNSPEQESTTHFVIVDKQGNIVSMTSTIENAFGSRLMVNGFLLNNELTDFSFLPEKNGQLIANRVEAGKRPRSSMAPTIVFRRTADGKQVPYLAIGSPGGSRIINFVSNALIRILDWDEDLQAAFDQPHILNRFGKMEIEAGTAATQWSKVFEEMGYPVSEQDINSGLHGVLIQENSLLGAADKRREGTVMGR